MLRIVTNSLYKARLIILEVGALSILYFIIAWVLIPQVLISKMMLYILMIVVGIAALYYVYVLPSLFHQYTLEERGIGSRKNFFVRTDNFLEAWRLLLIPMLVMGVSIILAAWQKNTNFFFELDWVAFFLKFFMYLFHALVQDILFFSYILIRLKDLVLIESDHYKKILVVFLFATLFAAIHLPNIPLMILTFIFAFWFGYLFYSVANLHVIIIIHAFLGTLLHRVYELHMKIGIFYGIESQEGYLIRFLIPAIGDLIENRW